MIIERLSKKKINPQVIVLTLTQEELKELLLSVSGTILDKVKKEYKQLNIKV